MARRLEGPYIRPVPVPLDHPLLLSASVLIGAMLLLWLVSLPLRNASIVDVFWGPAFVVAAWTAALAGAGGGARRALALALVSIWGLRLGLHLARRNLGHGEDQRYAVMRRGHGARFWWVSLFTVFLLQAGLAWIISLPLQAAVIGPATPLGPLDLLAVALWGLGLTFEAVGDAQLARFRADPGNRGRALDTGLWRYTRHPNYFGDACVWWGLGLLGAAAGAPATLLSPVLMTFLLLRVSGVALLERDIAERRPAYRDYVARTSAFFPWFPRKAGP
jgi:steroid 5-alpha reductase family enzyme